MRRYLRPLAAALLWSAAGAVAPGQPPGVVSSSVRSLGEDEATLRDAEAAPADRAAAARRLIGRPDAEARAIVERMIGEAGVEGAGGAGGVRGVGGRSVLLKELAGLSSGPAWVVKPLAEALGDTGLDAAGRQELLGALAAVRTREAVRVLLEEARAAAARAGETADPAFSSLIRLTGRSEFSTDINRWETWFGQVQWLSEAEWRRELAEALGARADRLANQRDQLAARLVDALRQQYLTIESLNARSERLVAFLADPQPEVRRLGLTLAQQELANARQLEPQVGVAAAELLLDASGGIRRQAAEVVSIMAPEAQADRVAETLLREGDAEIAALLLKSVARWPRPDLTPVLLNWLEAGPPAAAPACDALDAADRRGWLTDRSMRDRALAVLRQWRARDAGDVPPSGMRLLYALGTSEDRDAVLALLHTEDSAQRWAAGTALAQVREGLDALLAAAHADAALFPLAAQAVTAFRPSAAGYQTLSDLAAADPAQRREKLLALSQELSHAELFRAASACRDPSMREAMLTRLLREPLAGQRTPGSPRTLKPEVIAGILLLSQARVELRQPAGALTALDALAAASDEIDPAVLSRRRVPLLIWLNRLDEAARFEVGAELWLEGLERCADLDHAAAVVRAIEERFGGRLDPPQKERLDGVRSRLPAPDVATP